jgi:hypothetical protein
LVTDIAKWLDSPAVRPGGALATEKKATLGPFDVVSGRLVAATSGVHRYGLSGTVGVVLQAKVATDAFEPVVVVIGPSGTRWDLSAGARAPDAGHAAPASVTDLVLPEAGEYILVVTSRANTIAGRALTNGEYRLTLLCDAPRKAVPVAPVSAPSSRSGRFSAWESEPR